MERGRLPGRSVKEKGREEGEADEDSGVKSLKKWLRASRERQARMMMPRRLQNWDCWQIENEEEEEEDDWQKEEPDGKAMG